MQRGKSVSDPRGHEARQVFQQALDDLEEIERLYKESRDRYRAGDRLRRWRDRVFPLAQGFLPSDEVGLWQNRAEEAEAMAYWASNGDPLASEIGAHKSFLLGVLDDMDHLETTLVTKVGQPADERKQLEEVIERLRNLMAAVATGGPRIKDVEDDYKRLRAEVAASLTESGLEDPNPYPSLWDWYGKWSSGDLPTYQSRREYLSAMYEPTLRALRQQTVPGISEVVATGWEEVDRRLRSLKADLERASQPEHFQQIAYGCRGLYIALAQAVHDAERHPPSDEKQTIKSETDAKGRLTDYFAAELADESSSIKDYAKAVVKFADAAGHNQASTFRAAAACLQAAVTLMNLVALIEGRLDPHTQLGG